MVSIESGAVNPISSSVIVDNDSQPNMANGERSLMRRLCGLNHKTRERKHVQMARILLLALIPILGLAIMSVLKLVDVAKKNAKANQMRQIITFSTEVGNLIHFLQRERDMTALHLSGRDQGSETRTLLTTTYPMTDKALNAASMWSTTSELIQFKSKEQFAEYLGKHRHELKSRTHSAKVKDEIKFYSSLIQIFVRWLYKSIQSSGGGSVWRTLVAYQLLIITKEDMGIERTLGGVFFTQGGFEDITDYLWYMQKYYVGNGNFMAAKRFSPVTETYLNELLQQQTQNITNHVHTMRREITNFGYGMQNYTPSWERSAWWFDNMTSYLDMLFTVQLRLAEYVGDTMANAISADRGSINVSISLLALITIICPLIVLFVRAIVTDVQKYAMSLSSKTSALAHERKRTDALVYRMLPKIVAEQLKEKKTVDAEHYEDVTIFFSDIVGFTRISSRCTPMQVVGMLNKLYLTFDTRIDMYDVYKVETIGDAYMVASGVPHRNARQHLIEIGTLALDLMHHVSYLDVPHLPGTKMRLRAGIHTGPIVAGVVGSRMPRYCLFGETVSRASKMESSGLPGRIHISAQTNAGLVATRIFTTELRGDMDIQSKGSMKSYWLLKKEGFEEILASIEHCRSMDKLTGSDLDVDE